DTDHPAPGARHSAGHAVRVPDPARRRLRRLGPCAGAAADGHRQGDDRSLQGRARSAGGGCGVILARRQLVSTVLVCSTSGGESKSWPTRPRYSVKLSEPRKSTVWFSSVSHFTISR